MVSRQFFSFALIGIAGFACDTGVLYMLAYGLEVDLYAGRILSYLCAVTLTWWLNRCFTFNGLDSDNKKAAMMVQWSRFAACNIVGAIINYSIYAALISLFALFYQKPVFAVAIGTLFSVNVNFFLSKKYVF